MMSNLFLRQGFLLGLGASPCQKAPGTHLSPPSQLWDYKSYPAFYIDPGSSWRTFMLIQQAFSQLSHLPGSWYFTVWVTAVYFLRDSSCILSISEKPQGTGVRNSKQLHQWSLRVCPPDWTGEETEHTVQRHCPGVAEEEDLKDPWGKCFS